MPPVVEFSIIIPYRTFDHHVEKCLQTCRQLQRPNFTFEIILLPDHVTREASLPPEGLYVLATGPVYPSEKRNRGYRMSNATYCAFIDSDAYPQPDWLANAFRLLSQHPTIGCVGGPNHVPPGSPLLQRIGTRILFCKLGVGSFPSKPVDGALLEVKEMASSNLIVRRQLLVDLDGFDSSLLTAEDARLCFQIHDAGFQVVFSYDVAVFHHRRSFPWPFLRSIFRYGHDKAWLLKTMFTPDKYYYLVPTLFDLGLLLGALACTFFPPLRWPYAIILALYAIAVGIQSIAFGSPLEFFLGLVGIPATHITYGLGFGAGLLTKNRKSKT